jgi:hypothetical protein
MMCNLRKLLLLTVMAVAATAVVAAPTAFGQNLENHETLEVLKEPTLGHCPAVTKPTSHTTSGGCLIHVKSTGEVEVRKHIFGIESHIGRCENEFWGRLNEDGEGYVIHQKLIPHPDGLCVRQPCTEPGESVPTPWPAHGDEGHVPGVDGETGVPAGEYLVFTFCFEPIGGGSDESCEVSAPFNAVGGAGHNYEFGNVGAEIPGHGTSGFRCELVGHWQTEAVNGTLENLLGAEPETKIEIRHLTNENKAEVP